jgi:hypothetical protein
MENILNNPINLNNTINTDVNTELTEVLNKSQEVHENYLMDTAILNIIDDTWTTQRLEETKKDLWEALRSRKESKIPSLGLTIAITKISEIIKNKKGSYV